MAADGLYMSLRTFGHVFMGITAVALIASAFIVHESSTSRLIGGLLVAMSLVLTVYATNGRRHGPKPVPGKDMSSNGHSPTH